MFINFSNPIVRQYAVVIAANLTIVSLGLNVAWGSPILVKLRDKEQTVLPRPLTQQEEGLVISLASTGIAALLYAGYAIDNIGRKWTILACFFPKLIMSLFVIFANDIWMLYIGRIVAGQSDMTLIAVVSTYSSEASGKEIRGASGAMMQVMSALGMLIMLGIGPFVSYIAINVIMACVVVVVFIPTLFIPESPYFLFTKGKTDEAIEVLTVLRGSEALAHEEIKQYSNAVESTAKPTGSHEDTKTPSFNKWALLKDRTVIKAAGIILFLSVAMQLSGYNALNLYLQSIFDAANTSVSSEISSLIIGCIQLLACVVTFFITDKFGRKPILCTSMAAMAIGMIGLAIFFHLVQEKDEVTGFLNYLPLISIAIVVYGFNAGMGSLFWMLVAELLDGPIRSYGVTAAVVISIVTMFSLTYLFPVILAGGGATIYWVFAGCCIATGLFIGFVVPETKGKTFIEIQRALGRRDVNETMVKDNPS